MPTSDEPVAQAILTAARHRLAAELDLIEHCLRQLPDDDLGWRPAEGQNSFRTIVLHLCGNLRQWIMSGVGGAVDVRDRSGEFSDRAPIPRDELLQRLRGTVAEADAVLDGLDPVSILAPRRIQGFETTALAAILDTICHFGGHAQEITSMTRARLGDRYEFKWVPQTPEQGAPVGGLP